MPAWILRGRDGEGGIFLMVIAFSRPSPVIITVMRDYEDYDGKSSKETTG